MCASPCVCVCVCVSCFCRRYDELTGNISSLYGNAKEEHVKGVALLIQEFKYHPLFKRTGDTFSAVPFKPL